MKSKKGIIKIWFCLLLSLSLVVCGLSVAYAQTLETPAAPQGSTLGNEGVAAGNAEGESAGEGAGAGQAAGEAGGMGAATGQSGSEAAGTLEGSATVGVGGAAGGEASTATSGISVTGENTGAVQGLLGSQPPTANAAENGELLGAANTASTIDITVPQSISFRNSGLSPTLLRMKNDFTITNNSTSQAVSITSVAISAQSEYTIVANSTDFENMEMDSKKFSMVLNYGGSEYDCMNANTIPVIPIEGSGNVSLNFSGKISKVSTESNVNFAKLTLTIAAASSTEENTNSTESDT